MSAYELDDELVRAFVKTLDTATDHDNLGAALAHKNLGEALQEQLSLPRPHKIGAVVETDHSSCAPELAVFIRWASDIQTDTPWIMREELDRKVYGNAEIGRIVTILSEGVDV